jgi:ABC-type multidrug transport system ATPase subunit
MSAEQYLYSMGRISGVPADLLERQIAALLEAFQLTGFHNQRMTGYSKGMLQKVNLIQSLLGTPELLLLDEPLSGLDLPAQHTLISLLQQLKHSGTALVFSVHETPCVEALDAGVHVLQAGRTLMIADAEKLRDKPSSYIVSTVLTQQAHTTLTEMTGYISSQDVHPYYTGEKYIEWRVDTAWTDEFLQQLLNSGGSVLSLERRNGTSGLEQWMDPKQNGEGDAG